MTIKNFWSNLRRVVTGVDATGRSRVIIDDNLPCRHMFDDISGFHEVWIDSGQELDRQSTQDQVQSEVSIVPAEPDGVRFLYFTMNPNSQRPNDITDEEYKELVAEEFAASGSDQYQRDTSRHPAMHETPTIDHIVLLQGRVKLILDEGERELKPFDTVVQRGTNHAWEVIGDEPALLVAVSIHRTFN